MFSLHENAIKNINDAAGSLLSKIEEIDLPKSNDQYNDLYSSATITEQDIIAAQFSLSNGAGNEICKYFLLEDKALGFIHDSYDSFSLVVTKIYKNKEISNHVTVTYIKNKLFIWIEENYIGKRKELFYDYFLSVCQNDIIDIEIIIPIPFTLTKVEFTIGQIVFKTLTEEMIRKWFKYIQNNDEVSAKKKEELEVLIKGLQKEFQGYLVGCFKCKAETTRAEELAYDNLNNSLSVLRLFSLANFTHDVANFTHEYGKSYVRTRKFFVAKNNEKSITLHTKNMDGNPLSGIDEKAISLLQNSSWNKMHNLLTTDKATKYQEKLLDAIIIYSKNVISREIYDKILYDLVSLESMLLKNDSEPIQQNIGERLAFLIGNNVNERKDIIKTIRSIYSIRSKYVHHGIIETADDELLRKFMNYMWLGFSSMVSFSDQFTTREELIEYLDNKKLS